MLYYPCYSQLENFNIFAYLFFDPSTLSRSSEIYSQEISSLRPEVLDANYKQSILKYRVHVTNKVRF